MDKQIIKEKLSKTSSNIIKLAAIVGGITVLVGAYSFYLNNLYVPNVTVVRTEYENGIAIIKYKGREVKLEGDAIYLLGGDWGVRLGSNHLIADGYYDRVELVKKGMVYQYLK